MGAMLLLKASLLLSVALCVARLLRRAPAHTRHQLWTLGFAALLALPFLAFALPGLYVPLPAGWGATIDRGLALEPRAGLERSASDGFEMDAAARPPDRGRAQDASTIGAGPGFHTEPREVRERSAPLGSDIGATEPERSGSAAVRATVSARLLALWLTGTTAAAAVLLLSLLRVRRLARTAREVDDSAWQCAADALGRRLGLERPARLLVSPDVGTPMAGGLWRPVIFLPASARTWSVEQRDVVLAHEIAHLAGSDPLRHLAARLAIALYWFHPLAWIAARQAAISREQACDQAVLALGTRPSTYARVLLDLAESIQPSIRPLGALPMVEPSLLETRVMAILNDDLRPPTRRRGLTLAISGAVFTLSVAAAQPAVPAAANVTPAAVAMAGALSERVTPIVTASSKGGSTDVGAPAAQANVDRDSACWWDLSGGSSFSGSISTTDSGGRTVIHEQIGTRGTDRVIQKSFGDVRLCMLAEGAGDRDRTERPSQWLGRARRVIMEARRGRVVQRLEIGRQAGAGQRTSWQVGGSQRDFDAAARQWRDRMLAALDTTWELATLRGEVSTLRGEISTIRGEESTLRGEISTLRGEVSMMQGRISTIGGEESTLRGRISSIRGHESTLRGAISTQQGAISGVNASRYGATEAERAGIDARLARHDADIARIEREIRDYIADAQVAALEREIAAFDVPGKIAALDAEIRAFDLDGKVAAVERRIGDLDVGGKVAAIERQVQALDADRRGQQLEARRDKELAQLEAAIAAVK